MTPCSTSPGARSRAPGVFRDAVRSTVRRVVYAVGLNLVVVTVRVQPRWGGTPIGVPVNARLHKKKDTTTTIEHAAAMIRELADWLPERRFHLAADGAYATLAGAGLPRTHLTSRIRRDAALYEKPPPHTGRRGRPRTRGDRLPTPASLAAQTGRRRWHTVTVDERGTTVQRLVHVRDVLWYAVNKRDLLRLVIVRDPAGIEPDDFFITTDLTATAPRPRPATPAAGPSRSVSGTSNSTSAPKTRNPGNAKVPNAPPAWDCGKIKIIINKLIINYYYNN